MTTFAIGLIGLLTQGCGEKGELKRLKPEPQTTIPTPTEACSVYTASASGV